MRFLLLASALLCASCGRAETQVADFPAQRERMVKEQIVMRGVVEERVLAAMRKVPREEFVPAEFRAESYTDRPLPIGYDQTISQPFIVAFMTEELRLQPTHRVLEIGTGSGYQAAILAELVAEVYSIEIIEPLKKCRSDITTSRLQKRARESRRRLQGLAGACAVRLHHRNLCARARAAAIGRSTERRRPHDYSSRGKVRAGALSPEKKDGRLEQSAVLPVRFVPMAGQGGEKPE